MKKRELALADTPAQSHRQPLLRLSVQLSRQCRLTATLCGTKVLLRRDDEVLGTGVQLFRELRSVRDFDLSSVR